EALVLTGLEGDDTFNIPGNHPYTSGISIQGDDPSASDVVNFSASLTLANDVTVNLGASTVQEATFAPVTLSGGEGLNVNAAAPNVTGHNAVLIGTAGDDTIEATPTGADAVTFRLTGSNPGVGATPVVNFSGVGNTMTVDGSLGNNALVFNGTANAD